MGSTTKQQLLKKIAKMELMGVPRAQMANSVSLSESRLSQIISADTEYQLIAQEVSAEEFTKLETLNGGWDMVESMSIKQVADHLEVTHDPEFALKVAAVSNKAQRRGLYNRPIGLPGGQSVAKITLNSLFVDKLEQTTVVNSEEAVPSNGSSGSNGSQSPFGFTPVNGKNGKNGSAEGNETQQALQAQPSPRQLPLKKKDTNFLSPSAVQEILDPGQRRQNAFAEALGDLVFPGMETAEDSSLA